MQSSPSNAQAAHAAPPPGAADMLAGWQFDDDLAIGCECADPSLQIESWGREAAASPLQDFA